MSVAYESPKVKVHIGDGFKFLADYKNEFDVIITDSSDPEGPAASLFEKPYFQLLSESLKEGGIITTQGQSTDFKMFWSPILLIHFPDLSNTILVCSLRLVARFTIGTIS